MLGGVRRLAGVFLAAVVGLNVVAAPPTVAAAPENSSYRAASPEYGISAFVYGNPATTARDLGKAQALGFGWQKSLFRWRDIEGQCKGCFTWGEADRVVQASAAAGLKIIARIDFQPTWARADRAHNGAPDNYQDFADFITAFTDRYKSGSPYGTVQALEVWNETNLQREWGDPISAQSAAGYVQLLQLAYDAAKAVDPSVTIVTAGLSPTGWNDDTARPDDDYLQWLYASGLKYGVNYDVLGAHGNTQCPSVEAEFGACPVQPERMPHASFYFRRIEQLREIMVANGDGAAQVWLLEFGWTTDPVNPSYSWFATTEDKKASLFLDAFRYATANWAPWIGVMTVWTLADPNWNPKDEQVYWAITNPDGTTRPAYDRLLLASQQGNLPGATPGQVTASTSSPAAPPIEPGPLANQASGLVFLRVAGTAGDGLKLRIAPSPTAEVVKVLIEGDLLQPLEEPRQAEGATWYKVRDRAGSEGWVAGEYVQPGNG